MNNVYGIKLQEQVEERLNFYETGDLPRKNLDVMEVRDYFSSSLEIPFNYEFIHLCRELE